MWILVYRKDQDIVEVYYRKSVENIIERSIDIILKGYGRIREAKGYNYIFAVPITGTEGRFLLIALFNTNLIVGILNINLTKDLSASKPV
jgi:hypothetical protein